MIGSGALTILLVYQVPEKLSNESKVSLPDDTRGALCSLGARVLAEREDLKLDTVARVKGQQASS